MLKLGKSSTNRSFIVAMLNYQGVFRNEADDRRHPLAIAGI